MSGDKTTMEKRLKEVRQRLAEIEALKLQEGALRKEEASIVAQLKSLDAGGDYGEVQAPDDEAVQGKAPMISAEDAEEQKKKRIKAINKKLQQIKDLRAKDGPLDAEARAKIESEPKLVYELECLKEGKPIDPYWEPPVKTAQLPRDQAEREKRVKALRKKQREIEALKEKGGSLDAEAQAKLDSERAVNQEIEALESGANEVVFAPPTEEEKLEAARAEKIEIEKRIKATKKKLDAIEVLKKKGGSLDAEQQAKVDSEAEVKKELGTLERKLGAMNKEERERVAKKLGFEEEAKANMDQAKAKSKAKKR